MSFRCGKGTFFMIPIIHNSNEPIINRNANKFSALKSCNANFMTGNAEAHKNIVTPKAKRIDLFILIFSIVFDPSFKTVSHTYSMLINFIHNKNHL